MKRMVLGSVLMAGVSAFAATTINLANADLATVEGSYTVEGKVITLTRPGEQYTLTGNGTTPQWSVKLGADCVVTLSAVTLKPASGAALDANGHLLDLNLVNVKSGNTETGSTLTGAAGCAGLQLDKPSSVTVRGAGALTATGNGGAASIGSARDHDLGSLHILSGTVTATAPGNCGTAALGAAIGAGYCGNGGMISIEGGVVSATGNQWGAAIGAGTTYNSSKNVAAGTIRILGGTVTATGGKDGGAALGGGHGHASNAQYQSGGGVCEILGGTVTLNSGTGDTRATIGGGKIAGPGLDVTIDAAATVTMNAQGTNMRQFGCRGEVAVSQGTLKFTNRKRVANHIFLFERGSDVNNYLVARDGFVTATVDDGFASANDIIVVTANTDKGNLTTYRTASNVVPEVPEGFDAVLDLDTVPVGAAECYTRRSDNVIEIAANKKLLVIGTGFYESSADMTLLPLGPFDLTLSNAKIRGAGGQPGLDVNGQTGTLRLAAGTTSYIYGAYPSNRPAISLENANSQLTIEGPGSLNVWGNGALAAGIGGGANQSMLGTLVINGGTLAVTPGASSNGQSAAAIGGGDRGSGGTVIVNGGTLTANAVAWGAAIGSGNTYGSTVKVSAGSLTVNGGMVTLNANKDGGAAFGSGHCQDGADNFTGGTITINGGTVVGNAGTEGKVGDGLTAILGGGKYSEHGVDVSIDVAATVELLSKGTSTPAFGATRATEANKGSLTFTDKFNTTEVRRFLMADACTPYPSAFTGTMASELAERMTYLTGPGSKGFAQSWTFGLPADAEILDLGLAPAEGSTAWTLNGSVYELNGTKSIYVRGNNAYSRTLKLTGDFVGGKELVLMRANVSSSAASPLELDGHALDLRLANGVTNGLTASGGNFSAIHVGPTATLTIKGASYENADQMGFLRAQGHAQGAGIGGNTNERCGTVYLKGGHVTAVTSGGGGKAGAGIGGGWCGDGPVLFEMTDGWLNAGKDGQHGCGVGAGSSYAASAGTSTDAGHIVFKGGYADVGGCTDGGAAIGGGHSTAGNQSGGGIIEFLGGTVIATGAIKDSDAAVIGGGKQGGNGSTVILDVNAYLEIHRGNTTNRWGIGKSWVNNADKNSGSITITNAKGLAEERVFLRSEFGNELANGSGATVVNNAEANGYRVAAMSGEARYTASASVVDVATASGENEYTSTSASVVTIKKTPATIYGSGKSVVCNVDGEVTLEGASLAGFNTGAHAVRLVLKGANTSTGASGKAGITVAPGGSLVIDGDGSLVATGNNGGAGIGGDYDMGTAGDITIDGGTITATPGGRGNGVNPAGLGAGAFGSCGIITVNGGELTANGVQWASAIGGSANNGWTGTPTVGKITINGGKVVAKGGSSGGSAIGGGHEANGGVVQAMDIEILGGTVEAHGNRSNSANDFGGAVIGGGRKATNVRVKISTAATVTTVYDTNATFNQANQPADVGSPTPGLPAQLTIVAAPGTEGHVFLKTSQQDIFNSERDTLTVDSLNAGEVAVAANGSGKTYTYMPAGVTWTGAGDGVKWSDAANWSGTLDTVGNNGTITFRGNCAAMENDVGPIVASQLRNASGGSFGLTGAPVIADGNLTLAGGAFTFDKLWVGGGIVPEAGVSVSGGNIYIGSQTSYPNKLEFVAGEVEIGFLTPPNARNLFVVGPSATVAVDYVDVTVASRYLSEISGTLVFNDVVSMVYPGSLRLGGTGGTIRLEKGVLVGADSIDLLDSATFVMGDDIRGDTVNFYCIYGTGAGVVFRPKANDFKFEDTVSVEGNLTVYTSDANEVARTVTFERGIQCRAKGTLSNVNIAVGTFTLTVKGTGTAVVNPRKVEGASIAFNQRMAIADTAKLQLATGASLENGMLSIGAGATLAFDGDAPTLPSMAELTCASGARLEVSGMANWNASTSVALLEVPVFNGSLPIAVVKGKERKTLYRDGKLWAVGGGLVLVFR